MTRDDWNRLYRGDSPDSGTGTEEIFLGVAREQQPGRALDLGCGPGALTLALAELGWTVTGIDFAEAAIGLARRSAADRGLQVRFVVADFADWSPVEPFDLVVSAYALPPRGAQRDAALAVARRALAPGGTLVIAEWHVSMAEQWSFVQPEELASRGEVAESLAGLSIERSDLLETEFEGSARPEHLRPGEACPVRPSCALRKTVAPS